MMIDLEQFVGKTVVVTRGNGTTREGIVEINDNSNFPYKLRWPDGSRSSYTRDGYFWSYKTPDILNIKSIKLKEEESMIDLEQFVNKTVVVIFENGTTEEGLIERTDTFSWPYKLEHPDGSLTTYTKDGYFWVSKRPSSANIKSIKLKEESLQQRLETIQREAELIKQQLEKSYPTIQDANPGDLLEDGTVVIEKYGNAVLIAAPQSTEVSCQWTPEFQPVFDKLKEHNFNPSQWFVPSQKQLLLAYNNAKQYFSTSLYWSSTEASSSGACRVNFKNGRQFAGSKSFSRSVRAFRFVSF
jgi:small nuclear ribonucleoprotein (snRNP)-like protein